MFCPKCHQPLDDAEEPYICCAGASLQWRCERCAKVSEGFAYPYGRCPHCGGTLQALADARIDDGGALQSVRKAFEIELGGQAFYARASAESTDPILRDLFGRLAEMESEHMATLTRRYHARVPAKSGEFDVELAAIFGGVESRPADPANLFRIAIGMEQRASRYFAECADAAPAASVEQQLYRELAAEEREHADILSTEYARWQAGKPGALGEPG